jgi:hypothetical protein
MRNIEHIPSQKITITINGLRFPGNWDTNLRWSINGTYTKLYLMQKHGWSDSIWKTIDFSTVKAFCNHKTYASGSQWFKFMHDLQPLGKRKIAMGRALIGDGYSGTMSMLSDNVGRPTPFYHLPKQSQSFKVSRSTDNRRVSFRDNHPLPDAFSECLEQWMQAPNEQPSITKYLPTQPTNPYRVQFQPHIIERAPTSLIGATPNWLDQRSQGFYLSEMANSSRNTSAFRARFNGTAKIRGTTPTIDYCSPSSGIYPTQMERTQ